MDESTQQHPRRERMEKESPYVAIVPVLFRKLPTSEVLLLFLWLSFVDSREGTGWCFWFYGSTCLFFTKWTHAAQADKENVPTVYNAEHGVYSMLRMEVIDMPLIRRLSKGHSQTTTFDGFDNQRSSWGVPKKNKNDLPGRVNRLKSMHAGRVHSKTPQSPSYLATQNVQQDPKKIREIHLTSRGKTLETQRLYRLVLDLLCQNIPSTRRSPWSATASVIVSEGHHPMAAPPTAWEQML